MTRSEKDRLDITILGSGTCVPSLRRSSCALLMETGGVKWLFDCGAGTLRRLLETGTEIFDIDTIFLSHFHPDHSGELVSFLFATKYPEKKRRKHPLKLAGGLGIIRFFENLKQVYGDWIVFGPGMLEIIELDTAAPDRRTIGPVTVETAPMAHNPESLGYRVTAPGGASAVYSGDTDYTDRLIALAEKTDLLICESALPDDRNTAGHLTPSRAGAIAAEAEVSELILTHFYPECDHADMVAECRKTYSGPLRLAEDLMRIRVAEG